MSKKRILVIITEGETDEEFYKKIIDEIKKVNGNKIFDFSEIKHICSKSITKMHKKMLGKFKNEVCCSKYNDYEKVVCFCYDNDVFEFNQNPPINRPKMKKEFLAAQKFFCPTFWGHVTFRNAVFRWSITRCPPEDYSICVPPKVNMREVLISWRTVRCVPPCIYRYFCLIWSAKHARC